MRDSGLTHLLSISGLHVSAVIAAAYLLAIASWAPFMVALRLWSGSVWPAVIVHGALNSIRVFLTQSIAVSDGINWTVEIAGAGTFDYICLIHRSMKGQIVAE